MGDLKDDTHHGHHWGFGFSNNEKLMSWGFKSLKISNKTCWGFKLSCIFFFFNLFKSYMSSIVGGKGVNTVQKAVLVWPAVRYILDTGQYRCTISGLPLFYIFIYIYMYVCVCVCIIINIKVYHKTFPQFKTNYSWF